MDTDFDWKKWRAQMIVIVLAAGVAWAIVGSGEGQETESPPSPAAAFDMLSFLDERVGFQEDQKDVRCWSSFNKLQMFITNCEIDEGAKAARISEHMRLIQALYESSAPQAGDEGYINADAVKAALEDRFPQGNEVEEKGVHLGGRFPTLVGAEELRDYSDTIEPWRLLQTWASRQLDAQGMWRLERQFDESALGALYDFFRLYDLAMLRRARDHAFDRKLTKIDAEAITAAFQPAFNH